MLKINKKDIIAFILCFSFIPVYAFQMVIGSGGYAILMMASSAYVTYHAVRDKSILKSFLFTSWTVLLVWMTICSFINSQNLINTFYYVGKVAFWFLLNDWYFSKGSLRLLKSSRKYMTFLIVITFLQQIFAPGIFGFVEGTSGNLRTFFASDNFLGYYYTAYIALCFILDFVECGKVRFATYCMLAVCMSSICLAWAVKNVIGTALIILYVVFVYRKKIARILGPRILIASFVLIFIGVVFFEVQAHFYDVVNILFGKSTTFSVRSYLWKQALGNIAASPLFGYGIPDGGWLRLQQNFGGNARSSHNIILELILQGGFLGGGVYAFSVVRCLLYNAKKYKKGYRYEYLFLLFNIFVFFIMEMASGSIYYPFYYMPIILIANLDKLIKIKEVQNTNGPKAGLYSNKLQYNN